MAITAAHVIIGIRVGCALGGTVLLHLIAARPFLGDAECHGHLKHMSAAVGGAHLASARVNTAVRATGRPGHSPTRLSTRPRRLAVLATGAYLERWWLEQIKMGLAGQITLFIRRPPPQSRTTPWPQVSSFIWHVEL